ncbi:MAG TPA: efflux RND transporter permease subunit [Rhodopila sp.]
MQGAHRRDDPCLLGELAVTLIVVVSIPLSILASIAMLSATGETFNLLTLDGLALAVGILADDATVDAGEFRLHVRAAPGTRLEVAERLFDEVENTIREIVPERQPRRLPYHATSPASG